MDTVKLKSDLHKLVDEVQNAQLLQAVYDFLKSGNRSKNGVLWEKLTEEERHEVLLAFEESEHDYNLIEQKKAFKKS
jgi:hypothetical protein